jgi:hypothetical protein
VVSLGCGIFRRMMFPCSGVHITHRFFRAALDLVVAVISG